MFLFVANYFFFNFVLQQIETFLHIKVLFSIFVYLKYYANVNTWTTKKTHS